MTPRSDELDRQREWLTIAQWMCIAWIVGTWAAYVVFGR